jgi:hypothetical protein
MQRRGGVLNHFHGLSALHSEAMTILTLQNQ